MLYCLKDIKSRSASAENPSAMPGGGGIAGNSRKGSPCIENLRKGETCVLLDSEGSGVVRHIWMTIQPGNILHMRNIIIRMYWDGQRHPSVEVPLGDFFGVAHGRQRNMLSECVCMQNARGFNSWIPMPFKKHALITVENDSDDDAGMFFYQIDFTLGDEIDENSGYFHAKFNRRNPCPMGKDYVILDEVEGRGVYLGTVLGVRSLYKGSWWGEGEVKFYIDGDDRYPTICGTGAEDYAGFAWGLSETITPYQGVPLLDNELGLYSLYRFHVRDPIYFNSSLKVTIQQIGYGSADDAREHFKDEFTGYRAAGVPEDSGFCYYDRSDDYCSVAYWYQTLPAVPFRTFPSKLQRGVDLLIESEKDKVRRQDI